MKDFLEKGAPKTLKVPLPSYSEEKQLIASYKKGLRPDSLKTLFEKYFPIIKSSCKIKGLDIAELSVKKACEEALKEAANKHSLKAGYRFSTYLIWFLKKHLEKLTAKGNP